MESTNNIVGDNGSGSTWLIWCIVGALTVGRDLFGEAEDVFAVFGGRHNDVVA